MGRQRAADQSRRARTESAAFHFLPRRLCERGMIGEAEIVVGGKIADGASVANHVRTLSGSEAAGFAKEIFGGELREGRFQNAIEIQVAHRREMSAHISRTA